MEESLEALKEAVDRARSVTSKSRELQEIAENSYAKKRAELVGLRIGSIVRTKARRYIIIDIKIEDWSRQGFKPYGSVIRKDGTVGSVAHIWQDWTLEPTGEEQA